MKDSVMSNGEEKTEKAPFEGKKYVERIPTVEAVQFDGENGEDVVSFVGGKDYGKVSGKDVVLTLGGKDVRGGKVSVSRGQWIVKQKTGTVVVNEGEFAGKFVNEDGSDVEPLEPEELPEPIAEEKLVYQPGFRPLTEEEKKATKAEEKQDWK
jgi:hypothetical protein